MSLKGKRILVGITGGIAAYKIASFIRLLKNEAAEVRCMMTPAATHFITPLTVATLSENPVGIEFYDPKTGAWTNHVEWALWADCMIFAPVTASSLAKMANGFSDNFLLATFLSAKCPVFIAPAMDLDMYAHPTTKRNISQLAADGTRIIPAESGFLASGLQGEGRMAEAETMLSHLRDFFERDERLINQRILITAGPTYEAIDPVRFIGNHSSGKMGFALAEAAARKGAEVVLITGPTACQFVHEHVTVVPVKSAHEMLAAVQIHWETCHVGVFSAAVADYRPIAVADNKLKKSNETLTIELTKNPDILAWAAQHKTSTQKIVGFALETTNGLDYAKGKLESKHLDAIVLNEIGPEGVGFGTTTNAVTFIDKNNKIRSFELQAKTALATKIIDAIYAES
jgi:phosphopantothenoylcysteine decarboxylase/phosphopantothenate--cysteine ligase